MDLKEYPDREMLALRLADTISASLKSRLLTHDRASLCVPGGSSPGETFATLSGAMIDWSRIDVFLGDERWVPEDHPKSNTALLKRTLLTDRAAAARHVPLVNDAPSPEEGIPDLLPDLDDALPISVLLLGMGEDGHTASLFPDAPELGRAMANDAPVLLGMHPPSQEERRITLSAPVLRGAIETHVLVMGEAKREALERARRADPADMPVAAFLREATVHWAP
jgi:6-phosphogluconolactonase